MPARWSSPSSWTTPGTCGSSVRRRRGTFGSCRGDRIGASRDGGRCNTTSWRASARGMRHGALRALVVSTAGIEVYVVAHADAAVAGLVADAARGRRLPASPVAAVWSCARLGASARRCVGLHSPRRHRDLAASLRCRRRSVRVGSVSPLLRPGARRRSSSRSSSPTRPTCTPRATRTATGRRCTTRSSPSAATRSSAWTWPPSPELGGRDAPRNATVIPPVSPVDRSGALRWGPGCGRRAPGHGAADRPADAHRRAWRWGSRSSRRTRMARGTTSSMARRRSWCRRATLRHSRKALEAVWHDDARRDALRCCRVRVGGRASWCGCLRSVGAGADGADCSARLLDLDELFVDDVPHALDETGLGE